MLIGCSSDKKEQAPVNFGTEVYDSTALHVALVPNKESLPIYYAQERGIFKRLGLNLQIATYPTQLDCDTALLGQSADGGIIDRIRLQSYAKRASHLTVLWKEYAPLQIFACNSLRIKNIKNLYGRTIGISRHSSDEQALMQALAKAHIDEGNVYRPQINNLKLRTEMLTGDQIDAAVLSWPYTSLARALEHNSIYTFKDSIANICFVQNKTKTDNDRIKQQWTLCEKGRKMAIDSLKTFGSSSYALILQKEYGIPQEVADTIKY